MSDKAKTEEVKTVKVKLLADHTHADMKYSAGVEIELPEHDATWLKNLKIAEETKPVPPTPPTKEEK